MPEPILLLNPRRKHKRKKNSRHRRHHARRAKNPRGYHVRRRRRRNPRGRGFGGIRTMLSPMGIAKGVIIPAGIGGLGAIGLDIALAYLPVPDTLKTGLPATITKLLAAIGLGWGLGKVIGNEKGKLITLGAVTVMGYQFLRDQAKTALPNVKGLGGYADYVDYSLTQDRGGVGAYMAPRLGFISPAPMVGAGSGMGAYMSPDLVPSAGVHGGFDWNSGDGM